MTAAVVLASGGSARRVRAGDLRASDFSPSPVAGGVVVAELFTSEGCSSCPPADAVLNRLVNEPIDGVTVIGLGEHVDYWDRLGWRDAFSSPAFSNRQSEYDERVFHTGSIYTPQLVIDGRTQVIGSDVSAVRRAIAEASRFPKVPIEVDASLLRPGEPAVDIRVQLQSGTALHEKGDVIVAVTENGLSTDVARGENRGRRLSHAAVVRSLASVGSVGVKQSAFHGTTTVPMREGWAVSQLKVVAVLQERTSRRIVGGGVTAVRSQPANASN